MLGSRTVRARRSLVVVLSGLVVAALALAGCAEDEPEEPRSSGPTLLSVAVYGPEPVITAYTAIANTFSTEHPGTSISIERYADAAAARAEIAKQVAAGTAPDLFLSPVEALPSLEESGALRKVGDLLLDRDLDFGDGYQRYALEAFSSDHSLQCMPVDSSPMVVYYNTDLVDLTELNSDLESEVTPETGWSFEQFTLAAQQSRAEGARGLYVEPSLEELAPFVFSGGGRLLDNEEEPTRLALSDGSSKDALLKVLPLFRDPVVNFGRQDVAKEPALKRFKNGELAMMLGYRSLTPELRAAAGLSFDVMPVPQVGSSATVGESSGMCISADSPQIDQAADFLAYVVSDAGMSQLASTGYVVPTNNDTAHAEAFLQADQQPASATVFTDQIRFIRALPTTPVWPAVAAAAAPALADLLYDPLIQSVEERLEDIDEASEELFAPAATGTPTP